MQAQAIIEAALRKIRVKAAGYSLSNEEIQDGLTDLNLLLQSWSLHDLFIPYRTRQSVTLTAGDGEYSIGSGGDLNVTKPLAIHVAKLRSGTTDYPLDVISVQRFEWELDQSSTGVPEILYYEPVDPLGKIYLIPIPDIAYTLILDSLLPITTFTSLTTEDSLPDEYLMAVIHNLAVVMASDYGKPPPPAVAAIAMRELDAIKGKNAAFRVPQLHVDAALLSRASFHIESS